MNCHAPIFFMKRIKTLCLILQTFSIENCNLWKLDDKLFGQIIKVTKVTYEKEFQSSSHYCVGHLILKHCSNFYRNRAVLTFKNADLLILKICGKSNFRWLQNIWRLWPQILTWQLVGEICSCRVIESVTRLQKCPKMTESPFFFLKQVSYASSRHLVWSIGKTFLSK